MFSKIPNWYSFYLPTGEEVWGEISLPIFYYISITKLFSLDLNVNRNINVCYLNINKY